MRNAGCLLRETPRVGAPFSPRAADPTRSDRENRALWMAHRLRFIEPERIGGSPRGPRPANEPAQPPPWLPSRLLSKAPNGPAQTARALPFGWRRKSPITALARSLLA